MFLSVIPGDMDNLTAIFADDTKLHAALTYDVHSLVCLKEDLTKLQNLSTTTQMKFHPDKCHILHLEHSNSQNPHHLNSDSGDRHRLDAVTL